MDAGTRGAERAAASHKQGLTYAEHFFRNGPSQSFYV